MRSCKQVKAVCLLSALLMLGFIGTGCGGGTSDACKNVANACVTEDSTRCNAANDGVESCMKDANNCLVWTASMSCGDRQTCQSTGAAASCRCDSECTTADATQCNPTQTNIIQTCTADTDGCLFWQDGVNCADTSKFCDDTSGDAVCSETCTDKCTAGATQCNGTIIQGCAKVGDCYDWVDGTDCGDNGQICSDTGGTAGCYAPCTDACDTLDATRCSGDTVQTCAVGDDGCNAWTDTTDCSADSQYCVENAGAASCSATCQDRCTDGETQCDGDTIQTCAVQASTCTDWNDTTTCNAPREACDDSAEPAVCVEQCTDACDPAVDASQCDGTMIQACQLSATSGCYEWVDQQDCNSDGKFCDNTADPAVCVDHCTNECDTLDAVQCSALGDAIEKCAAGADGCNDWVVDTDCSASGQKCYNSKCVDTCTDDCDTVDATQCNGIDIETCQLNSNDGCNDWVVTSTCADPTPACDDTSGSAKCVCTDECDTIDATRCNAAGVAIEKCAVGADGCNDWTVDTICQDPTPACDLVSGTATCVCADECSNDGDTQCNGDNVQTCAADGDADTCLEWKDTTDCTQGGTSTDTCGVVSGTAQCVCTDACALSDLAQCDVNNVWIQTCQVNATTGCNEWTNTTDCSAGGSTDVCDDTTPPAQCVATCTNVCTENDTRCNAAGDAIETCQMLGSGCTDWVETTQCTGATPACADVAGAPTCVCVDDCSPVGGTCNGDVPVNCVVGADGCNDLVTGTDCSLAGQICATDGTGAAVCMDSCTEVIADGSFEGGTPNADWDETSTNFGTPLCDPSTCGSGTNYARTGTFWAWFGGIDAVEVGTLSQAVTLPSGLPVSLTFFLWIPAANGEATDTFVVDVDGTTVFSASALDVDSYTMYTLVTIDISSYADGNAHTITFTGTTNGAVGGNLSNFFLDDVSVGVGPSCCVDACTDGVSFCDGTIPTACIVGTSGCTEWQAGADCLDNNQECQMVGDPAVATCVACTDECTAVNDQRCNGSVIETCVVGPDTCNDWQAGTDCSQSVPPQYCDDSGASPVCADFTVAIPGNNCTDSNMVPISIPADLPTLNQGDTTCGRGDDYNGTTCLGNYDGGEDIIYSLDVTQETIISVVAASDSDYWGIALDPECPPGASDQDCILSQGVRYAGGPYIFGCYRLPVGSYSIMFDTWPTPDCINALTLALNNDCNCATGESQCLDANTLQECDYYGQFVQVDCPNGCGELPAGSGSYQCLPTALTVDGGWTAGDNPTGADRSVYSFTGTAGTTYYVWWDDTWDGSGTYAGDEQVSAYQEDFTTAYFSDVDSGYSASQSVTIVPGETTVYIVAHPYGNDDTYAGPFAIAVSSTNTLP